MTWFSPIFLSKRSAIKTVVAVTERVLNKKSKTVRMFQSTLSKKIPHCEKVIPQSDVQLCFAWHQLACVAFVLLCSVRI